MIISVYASARTLHGDGAMCATNFALGAKAQMNFAHQ
jgi:hypothetical protein